MVSGKCELNIPYPPTETEGKNPHYARLLLNDYAGAFGELTASAQYYYQSLITRYRYRELADVLECFSAVEGRHLKMLGELILLFGGNPLLRVQNQNRSFYWSGKFVPQTQDIKRFLAEDINGENRAVRTYKLRLSQINDRGARSVLERIIQDEEHHAAVLKNYLDELS